MPKSSRSFPLPKVGGLSCLLHWLFDALPFNLFLWSFIYVNHCLSINGWFSLMFVFVNVFCNHLFFFPDTFWFTDFTLTQIMGYVRTTRVARVCWWTGHRFVWSTKVLCTTRRMWVWMIECGRERSAILWNIS
jgi:hypothetical protein